MRRVLPLLLVSLACGSAESEAPPASPEVTEHSVPEPAAEEIVEEEEEEQGPPSLGGADLDAMDRGELEAACYQGSNSACDRLGH